MVFLKKNLILGNSGDFRPKVMCGHNSGSALTFYPKIGTMNGMKRYIKTVLIVFPKKLFFWANWPFWA